MAARVLTTMSAAPSSPGPSPDRERPVQGQLPLPPALPVAAAQLLGQAHRGLAEAAAAPEASWRYATAHLAALRGAAALLAARTQPESGRRRPRSAWVLISQVAPELAEWAAFFAAGAAKRAAAEAGLSSAVTEREADDLVRDVATFLRVVEATISRTPPPAPVRTRPGDGRRPAGRPRP
ncbi:SAV_6107 family HEPN domain-containing protein [Modestobacter sp. SYSU DS0290]